MAMAPAASASSAVPFTARPATAVRPRTAAAAAGSARPPRAGAEGGKWWAPLLGWSGRADYLEAPTPAPAPAREDAARARRQGLLTEEKARELRARMVETESFHDAMYHSAIASRLARSA